jgi:hypothetical protein
LAVMDLGHGVVVVSWIVNRFDERVGLIEEHDSPNGRCRGSVLFRGRAVDTDGHPTWIVEKEEPLTLSPSIKCRTCGHHGYIKGGRWEP